MDDNELVTKGYLRQEFKREFAEFEKKMDDKFGVLVEKMDDNNRLLMEIIIPMKERTDCIPKIEEDISNAKAEAITMQTVLKVTNADVSDHERRIAKLELASY